MKTNRIPSILLFFVFLLIPLLNPFMTSVQSSTEKTFEDLYPGLASAALKSATLANLPKGTLLTAGSLTIKESVLTRMIRQSEPAVRKQLAKNSFFLLENIATEQLLLQEARKPGFVIGGEHKAITDFLAEKIKISPISEEEINTFYNQQKEMVGNATLEEIRGMLKDYLTQQKRQEAVQQYILTLGKRTPIRVNEVWAKKHSGPALNNPVDRARRSGISSMVEFGAPGCPPCEMMAPILAEMKKKFPGKLNVLYVHVGKEQILGSRFGIDVIPVQVFFDKNGLEVFRHTGFFPQAEIEKIMTQLKLL